MPFISSVRGSYGPQSRSRKNLNSSILSRITGGSVTTAGGYRIHTFTSTGQNSFDLSQSGGAEVNAECFVYGAGGAAGYDGGWGYWSSGGAGGYSTGNIGFVAKPYIVMIGDGGYDRWGNNLTAGGGAGGTTWGNGGGGGLSGIFNTSYSFANSLLIAGGGGGGGSSRASSNGNSGTQRGGGGGGSTGSNGASYNSDRAGRGGTQTGIQLPLAGDYAGGGWTQPGQLFGGHPQPHGGGGGGGYYGGSGGSYYEPNDMGGGGGGSGFAASEGVGGSTVSNATLTQASFQSVPTGGPYYDANLGRGGQSRGERGGTGKVVIRYLI